MHVKQLGLEELDDLALLVPRALLRQQLPLPHRTLVPLQNAHLLLRAHNTEESQTADVVQAGLQVGRNAPDGPAQDWTQY